MKQCNNEDILVLEACDNIIYGQSYNDTINEDSYRIAKSIMAHGRGHICQYCDKKEKETCPFTMTERVKGRHCLLAYYKKLRKEYNIEGQPTSNKTSTY